jgi:hypothetical protein
MFRNRTAGAQPRRVDWGELSVSFHGAAEWYITRRNAWHKTGRNKQSRCRERADGRSGDSWSGGDSGGQYHLVAAFAESHGIHRRANR